MGKCANKSNIKEFNKEKSKSIHTQNEMEYFI